MSGLQHVQDDLYPEAKFKRAAKEAVDEVAAGDLDGEHNGDAERQPMPTAVPELGGLGELGTVAQQQAQAQGNKWWSWK